MLEKTIKPASIIALAVLLFVAFLLSFTPVSDYDAFWHLKTGQLILAEGSLPGVNTFSSLFPDHPWPNPEWLFQVLLAYLHSLGGFEAITVFKVAMVLLTAAALYGAMGHAGGTPLFSASMTVTALAAMQFRMTERPHLFSYLLVVVTFLLVQDHRRRGGRGLWLLPPIFAFWSNLHPELLVAWLLLASVAAGDALDRLLGRREQGPSPSLVISLLLCLPATCLNPETWHVLLFPFLHISVGPVVEVTEYVVTSPLRLPAFYLFAVLLLGSFMARGRRTELADLLPAMAVILFGAAYLRATPYLFLIGSVILCGNLSGSRRPIRLSAAKRDLGALLLAALSLTWAMSADDLNTYRLGWGLDESELPAAAADMLASGRLPGPLYNRYSTGGYLIWRLHPVMGVFQDGRLLAYPSDFIADFNADLESSRFPALLDKYGVQTAIVRRPGQETLLRKEEWGIVNWDDAWVLLLRRAPETREILAELEYRAFVPGARVLAVEGRGGLETMLEEMERNQLERRSPSAVTENNMAVVLLRLQRPDEAYGRFRKAGELGYAPAWLNHAGLALERGDRGRAVQSLQQALALDPGFTEARRMLEEIGRGLAGEGI